MYVDEKTKQQTARNKSRYKDELAKGYAEEKKNDGKLEIKLHTNIQVERQINRVKSIYTQTAEIISQLFELAKKHLIILLPLFSCEKNNDTNK